MSTNPNGNLSVEQIIRHGGASETVAAQIAATLKSHKPTELMAEYKEAKRLGSVEASKAHRLITAELIDRLGHPAVAAFEERAANEANERTIKASDASVGDIYVTREGPRYDRRQITRVQHRPSDARVEITLPDHTRTLNAEEPIVVERPEPTGNNEATR